MRIRQAIPFFALLFTGRVFAQCARATFERPWWAPSALHVEENSKQFSESRFRFEPDRTYSLAELIDLAETAQSRKQKWWAA
jgi:hypothetical protein